MTAGYFEAAPPDCEGHCAVRNWCAIQRGLAIDDLSSHNFKSCQSLPFMQWCTKKQRRWLRSGEGTLKWWSVVHASFLVDAAKEVGIEVEKVRDPECPLEVLQPKTKLCRQASLVWTVWHWSHQQWLMKVIQGTSKTRVNNSSSIGRTHRCSVIVVLCCIRSWNIY